jgi:GNAT superfamily N-acetyltransferase
MMQAAGEARIRRARPEDAAALAELATQLGYPSTAEEMAARLAEILPDANQAVLVAEIGAGAARGFAHVAGGIALQAGARAELLGLLMDEALRGRGIGLRLVVEAEEWAAARGFTKFCVRCNVVRAETHRFYEGLGYTCSKTQKYFRKSLAKAGNR